MQLVMEATYRYGTFIPDQILGKEKEGKRFRLIILEERKAGSDKEKFFKSAEQYSFSLPPDYKFNRDELYER